MKKLINTLSIFSLTAISSLSVISCDKKEIPKLTLQQEENDIVNAINLKNTSSDNSNVTIDNIILAKDPIFDGTKLSYDITIKQDAKTFLNNDIYRIPKEVSGKFDILNNKITNNTYNINYLTMPLNLENHVPDGGTLLGTGQNCVLYLNGTMFEDFMSTDRPTTFLDNSEIKNDYVTMNDNQWNSILYQIYNSDNSQYPNGDYGAIIIVKNGKLYYTNATLDHYKDLPLGNGEDLVSSFISSNSISNDYLINKDILFELNDIYNSYKNNEDYGNKNWNIKNINSLFKNSNFIINQNNINSEYLSLATSFYNLFQNNYDVVSNLLNYYKTHNDNGIFISFDKNNNYLEYMN